MDYLFWRLPKEPDLSYLLCIIWYFWKNRNDKIYKNKTRNPQEIMRVAETEGTLWSEAQIKDSRDVQESHTHFDILGFKDINWCFTDGA